MVCIVESYGVEVAICMERVRVWCEKKGVKKEKKKVKHSLYLQLAMHLLSFLVTDNTAIVLIINKNMS